MEPYNDNRTPLERIDDCFLAELLDYDGVQCKISELSDMRVKGNCGCNNMNSIPRPERTVQNPPCTCNENHNCGNTEDSTFNVPKLKGYPLAMAYSPFQEFEDIYDCETAHKRGTIFKALDFPFYGGACDSSKQCRNCR